MTASSERRPSHVFPSGATRSNQPRIDVQGGAEAPGQVGQGVAFQPQVGPVARQERGAGQRHRTGAGADAAAATGAAAAAGSVSGPFWPQPASSAVQAPATRVVTQPAATLVFNTFRMRGF